MDVHAERRLLVLPRRRQLGLGRGIVRAGLGRHRASAARRHDSVRRTAGSQCDLRVVRTRDQWTVSPTLIFGPRAEPDSVTFVTVAIPTTSDLVRHSRVATTSALGTHRRTVPSLAATRATRTSR